MTGGLWQAAVETRTLAGPFLWYVVQLMDFCMWAQMRPQAVIYTSVHSGEVPCIVSLLVLHYQQV